MKHLRVVAVFTVILLFGCQRDVSGTYLMSDDSGVLWLQMVRTPDNRITGQIVYSGLTSDGKIDQKSNAVEGAVNGKDLTISFSGKTFGGNLDGNTVTLTGADPTPLVFRRANMDEYQKILVGLNSKSQNLLATKQEELNRKKAAQTLQETVSEIDRLVESIMRFDTQADIHLGKFPNAEKRLRDITAKINGYVNQERELSKKSNTSVDRSQLVVAEYQAALDTNQMHIEIQSLISSVTSDTKPLVDEIQRYENICASGPVGILTVQQTEQRNEVCKRLTAANSIFRQKYTALSNGISHVELIYELENNAQQDLIHTGEKLQNN